MKSLMWMLISMFCLNANASEVLSLVDVKNHKTDDGYVVELNFNQDIKSDQFTLDFINETVQINLPSVQLLKGTQKSSVSEDIVKSIYTYKVSNKLARTRVILNSDAMKYQNQTQLVAEGNILKLVIKNAVASVASVQVNEEDLKAAQDWVAREDAKENEKAQATQVKLTKEEINSLKESEIPVLSKSGVANTDKKTNTTARVVLSLVVVFGLLAAFGFYAKRNFAKAPKNKNNQIKVLTQHYLGPKKSLAIIRVAGESILIGVTDQNISLIKTLALMDEEVPQETPKDFSSTLNKIFKKDKIQEETQEQDEFSISKIKDVVSGKLKDMKEI